MEPSTHANSYFLEVFVYRGIPTKYFNLDYDTLIQHPDIKGHRGVGYDPMHPQNQNQNNDAIETGSVHDNVHNAIDLVSPARSERSHLSLQNLHESQSLQESNAFTFWFQSIPGIFTFFRFE